MISCIFNTVLESVPQRTFANTVMSGVVLGYRLKMRIWD